MQKKQAVLWRIRRLREEGLGYARMAKLLNTEGLKAKRAGGLDGHGGSLVSVLIARMAGVV